MSTYKYYKKNLNLTSSNSLKYIDIALKFQEIKLTEV